MASASVQTRKLNLAFVAELIAEGATEATLPTALAKIRDRYPVIPGGDKATNKLHSTRRHQVAIQLILALKIGDRYKLGALYPEFSSFLPKLMKAKPSAAVEGPNNNSSEPAPTMEEAMAALAAATAPRAPAPAPAPPRAPLALPAPTVAEAIAALAAATPPRAPAPPAPPRTPAPPLALPAPVSPERAYLYRTLFALKNLEELAEQYGFEEIVAIATGRHIRMLQKDNQRAYARLALDYESAATKAEKDRISEDIYDLLMEIARKAIVQEWNSYKITSMFSLKYLIERRLNLTGLPSVQGEYDSIILVEPLMTPAIREELAELDIDYSIAKATSADTSPIVKKIHEFFMRLYEEAVPAYKKRMRSERRREKYGNPQVDNSTLKEVNALYTKRRKEIEEGSGSPGTQKRRINALLQGQKTHFQAPRWAGTKCDKMLGFSQHVGECATDAVQQIVLFADPWKNKIQPLVYDLTDANIADLYDTLIAGPAPHPDRAVLRSLLLNIQRRFQNHYTTLQLLSHEEECVPQFDYRDLLTEAATEASFAGLSLKQKKKLSGELGPSLKRELTTIWPAAARTSITSTVNILSILRMMFRLFGISYVICDMVYYSIIQTRGFHSGYRIVHDKSWPAYERDAIHLKLNRYKGHTHLAFWFGLDSYYPLRPMTRDGEAGHATAIYCCESIWYYYDNNIGIVKLHPHLMEDLLNEVTEKWYIGTGYTADELVFYKIPHFKGVVDVEALPTKEIHYWNYTTQSWTPCLYKLIIDRHSHQFFHFGECIHIMTADHRHTGYTSPYLRYQYVYGTPTERPEPKSASPPKSKLASPPKSPPKSKSKSKSKSASPFKAKSPSKSRKSSTEKALLKRIADLKNVNNTEQALIKRIQNLKNVNNTEKALLSRIRSMTRKKSRSV